MTVGELRTMLRGFPADMEILNDRMSDYDLVERCDWSVVKAVPMGGWFMRSHPTMGPANKAAEKEYLHLRGH